MSANLRRCTGGAHDHQCIGHWKTHRRSSAQSLATRATLTPRQLVGGVSRCGALNASTQILSRSMLTTRISIIVSLLDASSSPRLHCSVVQGTVRVRADAVLCTARCRHASSRAVVAKLPPDEDPTSTCRGGTDTLNLEHQRASCALHSRSLWLQW